MSKCHPLRKKYPNRIPILVNFDKRINLVEPTRTKFLVPEDISLGQFLYILKKSCTLDAKEAIYIFINKKIIESSRILLDVYEKERNKEDNTLYLDVMVENTFG